MKIETLCTGARCCLKFSRRSPRERDFHRNFEKSLHGSAIFSKCSGRSARERDFSQNFQDALHGSAILIIRERYGADQFT